MLGNNRPTMSQLRDQVKNSDKYNIDSTTHNQPTDNFKTNRTQGQMGSIRTTPINNNFKTKLAIGGGALLGAGALGAAAMNSTKHVTGEVGSHFHDAFANITGVHENEGVDGAIGSTVASSSTPMVATGGKSFPILKESYHLSSTQPKLHRNLFKKQKTKI